MPNYHLAWDPLELPQGPLGIPGPHFENQCLKAMNMALEYFLMQSCISLSPEDGSVMSQELNIMW